VNTVKMHRQTSVSKDNLYKLRLSRHETEGLSLRDIRCPYCGYLVERVFSDVTGHKMVHCRKCKEEYPVNLGYFRRASYQKKYDGFHFHRQHR
jgi:phage FluMu protein Com